MAEHVEILVSLTELPVDPETPLVFVTTCQEDGPTAAVVNFDRVLVMSRAKAE